MNMTRGETVHVCSAVVCQSLSVPACRRPLVADQPWRLGTASWAPLTAWRPRRIRERCGALGTRARLETGSSRGWGSGCAASSLGTDPWPTPSAGSVRRGGIRISGGQRYGGQRSVIWDAPPDCTARWCSGRRPCLWPASWASPPDPSGSSPHPETPEGCCSTPRESLSPSPDRRRNNTKPVRIMRQERRQYVIGVQISGEVFNLFNLKNTLFENKLILHLCI